MGDEKRFQSGDCYGSADFPFVIPSISTCLRQGEGEMTRKVAMDARPGGPTAKRQPSPEGLG
jgi:hypothetical protein